MSSDDRSGETLTRTGGRSSFFRSVNTLSRAKITVDSSSRSSSCRDTERKKKRPHRHIRLPVSVTTSPGHYLTIRSFIASTSPFPGGIEVQVYWAMRHWWRGSQHTAISSLCLHGNLQLPCSLVSVCFCRDWYLVVPSPSPRTCNPIKTRQTRTILQLSSPTSERAGLFFFPFFKTYHVYLSIPHSVFKSIQTTRIEAISTSRYKETNETQTRPWINLRSVSSACFYLLVLFSVQDVANKWYFFLWAWRQLLREAFGGSYSESTKN